MYISGYVSMMEAIIQVINYLAGLVWGLPAIVVLVGTGLAIGILGGFFQIRSFPKAVKNMLYKGTGGTGEVKPFAAWAAVMGATIGVGNIAGVATALHWGGAGALFWMWVCALLGMGTKAIEITLGVWSRKVTPDGKVEGGTPYYIRLVPGIGPALAVLFSVLAFIAAFGIGNMVQANNVALGMEYVAKAFGWDVFVSRLIAGVLIMFLTALVVLGGIRRIADVATT